ncbi:MAG: hypothetical protein KF691_01025 [Phycisphaeraceae bacterium]|nr:hypothetical protein [Phycisphaeraceae bacterium]
MNEVEQAKIRLLDWAEGVDEGPSLISVPAIGPALGMAAAGLVIGHALTGRRGERGLISSVVRNVFSLATILPIAKTILPVLLKKL